MLLTLIASAIISITPADKFASVAEKEARLLPLGAVRPEGWLKTQLVMWRDGITGHAEELYDDIGKSGWLGVKDGDGWERGPYYARGLAALAFTLDDAGLKAKAKRWADAMLTSQRENGDFGPKNDNWWANMPALDFLRDWCEATGDERVVPFLLRYFRYQLERLPRHTLSDDSASVAMARGGDNLEVVLWTRRRTGETWLTDLARTLLRQTVDWAAFCHNGGGGLPEEGARMHAVNFMEGLKTPVLQWFLDGRPAADSRAGAYAAAFADDGWVMRQHGRVDRMVNGTESLSGRAACQGTELCAVAERILSCRTILEYGGFGPGWSEPADDMESVAYNTLPSTLSDDGRGVRYYHVLNMPSCAEWMSTGFECIDNGGAITPGPDAGFGCCRSNFHFAWPRFVQSMWMEENDADGEGLVAVAYGPCTVSNRVATVVEGGDYPFGDRVTMRITRTCDRAWRLRYRIPRWCDAKRVTVSVNGKPQPVTGELTRKWSVGDELEFVFPAEVTVERGVYDSIAVRRGALVYALKIEAKVTEKPTEANRKGWPVREYDAVSPWNYALVFDGRRLEAEYVPPSDLTGNVFAHGRAVSSIRARAYRTDYAGWGQRRPPAHFSARIVEPPPSPLAADRHASAAERITLIPLGATQIRITLFPWTGGM